MFKIPSIIFGCFVIVVIFVIAVSLYLAPDSLTNCQANPDGRNNCQQADYIVAVSGGNTALRAKKAIDLQKFGWAKKIIFSGDSADPNSLSDAENMRRFAISYGVKASDIIVEGVSKNTKENATNTYRILKELGAKDVILVSSPYHLRRVLNNFEKVNKDNINFRTTAPADQMWHLWFLKPSGWWLAISELAGNIEMIF